MSKEFVIFDTEYLTDEGVMARGWNGLFDDPPFMVQIAASRIGLDKGLPVKGTFFETIVPKDEFGNVYKISEYFIKLTGIAEREILETGRSFRDVLSEFVNFSKECRIYSYANDVMRPILQSCFISGISCPFKPEESFDIRHVLLECGMTADEINANSSGSLAGHFDLGIPGKAHDARFDVMSILETLRLFEKKGVDIPSILQKHEDKRRNKKADGGIGDEIFKKRL